MLVVDASPLIHLARVSLLELIRDHDPAREVVVPAVVFEEVMRGASHDPTTSLIEQATRDWLTIVPTPPPHSRLDPFKIDRGETAVLSVALSIPGATVVLDDLAARVEADRLGISKTGTLRLLINAKGRGVIPSVRSPLDQLRNMGMRLSDAIYREVLNQAGE
jgi:predicted nucleic acid-binding protein